VSICAVSIDLDAIACYYRIHGLGVAPVALRHLIIERCVPRAAAIFAEHKLQVTWFVVGQDVDVAKTPSAAPSADILAERAECGDELGNHSYSHRYELAQLDAATIADEVARGHRAIAGVTDAPVRGFRSPGYDASPALFAALCNMGYAYDSSLFPAPGYYAAKAVVMGALSLLGRPSGAVLTNPRGLLAPIDPYRPSLQSPWKRGTAPFIELPISVTPWARLPAIGTSLLIAPQPFRRYVLAKMAQRAFFNFEMHGIDFCDARLDELPRELVARQPDLRLPFERKAERLSAMLRTIAAGADMMTLDRAARRFV
jgi:peptidoglycan-N-acetylglucosamine deacetylase